MDPSHSEIKELSLLRSAVENTNEAFVTIDENHRVIFFNKAAENIFGYSRDEVVGHDLGVIMAPGCSRNHRHAVGHYLKTRVPRRIGHETELVGTKKNGEKFPANISFSVSEVDGEPYFTGIVRDLTETKALQERITKSERLAALGQVVAEITHEIKNPLMMIGGFANQLLRQLSDEKTLSKLNIISKEASRLEDLLDELRQYYQPRALQLEKIDMNNLLEEIFSLAEHDCRSKNINAAFIKEDNPLFFKGDRDKLKQVFLNLIKNAIEAMNDGGSLHIHTKLNNGLIEATIADEGCGIPECDREEIFSPFFTTKRHGTGLGLSISKSIVETHERSAFTFTSEEGKGTTFKITMPVFRAE